MPNIMTQRVKHLSALLISHISGCLCPGYTSVQVSAGEPEEAAVMAKVPGSLPIWETKMKLWTTWGVSQQVEVHSSLCLSL